MNIKQMLYAIWKKIISYKNPIASANVSITISKEYASKQIVTAPSVSGYTFFCWISSATDGWIGSTYFEDTVSPTTNVWVSSATLTGNGKVNCRALYIKNTML